MKAIPVATSLLNTIENESREKKNSNNKLRLITISLLSICIAIIISFLSKCLILLINLITNISFFHAISAGAVSPANNSLGYFVILIPAIGGGLVGLMALYGSKAIRGHGIPEAMEQILTNQSRIKPTIMYLKPLSSAISIGTGGPFGAEGPIIGTGGALGSSVGQVLKISHNERKILLAAGATAGMSAIFGTPIAGIFLAVELLLFEYSPRSFIPVALACITGAAGHHILFEGGYVFQSSITITPPNNTALITYTLIGIIIGFFSIGVTKIVYFIEDVFEKLPIHWAWWPSIGGLAVGIIGFFSPRTLGVGYNNITDILSGIIPFKILLSLCFLKFLSWAIALGSGTSGGTMAPLLTIGGAIGGLLGTLTLKYFPHCGVTVPLAALVGMFALFAGASRALITSVILALESTGQSNALLPLLGTCTASYFISYFFMENTIMTEKIARRGVRTPISYEPDSLEKISVGEILKNIDVMFSANNSIKEVREWLGNNEENLNFIIITNDDGDYEGILSSSSLFSAHHNPGDAIGKLVKRKNIFITNDKSLKVAIEIMAKENVDVLPVISPTDNKVIGILSFKDIISSYGEASEEHAKKQPHISLKRQRLKILVRGQRLISVLKPSK